jgi:hypothetical protein
VPIKVEQKEIVLPENIPEESESSGDRALEYWRKRDLRCDFSSYDLSRKIFLNRISGGVSVTVVHHRKVRKNIRIHAMFSCATKN